MASLDPYLDGLLARGRAHFSRDEIAAALALRPSALAAAITRAINESRLASPRHGFYLILRPEDQIGGVPRGLAPSQHGLPGYRPAPGA